MVSFGVVLFFLFSVVLFSCDFWSFFSLEKKDQKSHEKRTTLKRKLCFVFYFIKNTNKDKVKNTHNEKKEIKNTNKMKSTAVIFHVVFLFLFFF